MNKLYNQLKNIVDANVVRCSRTTTYKHLGSLHNPLSHGNWSKGAGMYGGKGGKIAGGLVKGARERLMQAGGFGRKKPADLKRPDREPIKRDKDGNPIPHEYSDGLFGGLVPIGAGKPDGRKIHIYQRPMDSHGNPLPPEKPRIDYPTYGYDRRDRGRFELQSMGKRGAKDKPLYGTGDRIHSADGKIDYKVGRGSPLFRTGDRIHSADGKLDYKVGRGGKGKPLIEPRTAVDFPRRGQAGSGGRQTMDRPRGGGRQTMDRPRGGGRQTMDRPGTGKRLQPDFPLWRGKKGAKDEPRTAVDFPRRGQAGTGKRLQPEARDNSGIRNKITEAISNISRGRQRQTPAERMSFQRQEYERRQKAPIVRTADGLPRHYEWVYGKGGDRLLPMDRPKGGGRQTMEYRAPRDSRGNLIPREDLPRIRREPYRPGKDKPEYRNMLK